MLLTGGCLSGGILAHKSLHCKLTQKPQKARENVTTQAIIASEAKQSPIRHEEIASSQEKLLAMTQAEKSRENKEPRALCASAVCGLFGWYQYLWITSTSRERRWLAPGWQW